MGLIISGSPNGNLETVLKIDTMDVRMTIIDWSLFETKCKLWLPLSIS